MEVVLGPTGDFAAEEVFRVEAAFVEAELKGAGGSLGEGNDNGAVAVLTVAFGFELEVMPAEEAPEVRGLGCRVRDPNYRA